MDITPPAATSKSPKVLQKVEHCPRHTNTNLFKLSGSKDLLHLWISRYEWPPPEVLENVEHCPRHTKYKPSQASGKKHYTYGFHLTMPVSMPNNNNVSPNYPFNS